MKNLEQLKSSIYKINTASGSGSGFYVPGKDLVITNYHVVAGHREVALEDDNQDKTLAKVTVVNPEADLAILRPETPLRPQAFVHIASDTRVFRQDKVFVLGFPFGMPFTVTEGIVSNAEQMLDGKHFVQTDAAVNPGNSGGPMVNQDGALIGVTTSKFSDADNVGFAIPLERVVSEIETYDAETEHAFALKCFSCSQLIHRAEEYCPNCGAGTDKDVFDEKELSRLAVFVESALEKLDFNPVLARSGNEYWLFHHGSSEIRIFVFKRDYLYAVSPLNELPAENLEAFYTFVLSDPVPPFRLGVSASNQLFISYRIHIGDIFVDEAAGKTVAMHLKQLAEVADRLDDELVDTYGCKMTVFAKKELKR